MSMNMFLSGTSNSKWEIICTGHESVSSMYKMVGKDAWDKALTFSIVRHPIDRYISACRQCMLDANDPALWDLIEQDVHPVFRSKERAHIFAPQVKTLSLNGELAVHNIFKFETDIPVNAVEWLTSKGLGNGDYPHRDPSPKGAKEKQSLTSATLQWAANFYREDFEVFNYRP